MPGTILFISMVPGSRFYIGCHVKLRLMNPCRYHRKIILIGLADIKCNMFSFKKTSAFFHVLVIEKLK